MGPHHPFIIFGILFASCAIFAQFGIASSQDDVLESDEEDQRLGKGLEMGHNSDEPGSGLSHAHGYPFFGYVNYGPHPHPHHHHSPCVKDSGDKVRERHGMCISRSRCEEMGATDSGSSCENGLTCCIFNATCDRSKETITVTRDMTYITHKHNEQECLTDYKFPRQNNVCQLRLEFKTFNLSPPNHTGNCLNDKMTIMRAGNLRDNLVLCGRANETDHLYLDYGECNEIVINLDVAQQSNLRDVEILVQQIKCNSADTAPEGCTQYFTQQRGEVRSFNFDRLTGQQLNNHVYAVCVWGSDGSNSITWNSCNGPEDFDITSIHPSDMIATRDCPTDSVTIPGSLNTKFCAFGTFIDIETLAKPYVMYVNFNANEIIPLPNSAPVPGIPCPPGWAVEPISGDCVNEQLGDNIPDIFNRGFCLRYQRA